ncbi:MULTISPECIES: hypothetical protein [Rhizobium]|uniref:hypothetical protein n=1 Tax=Rhizobium TaxID=379 RepID=UPI00103EEDD0|nr:MULTISPECIES: hypothetical protein [Rhizobium]MDH6659963.1 hypothetical protein [Rhizobium sophorae]MBB4522272.1 hypothetical protein [Rhizobium leguminosarum]NKK95249.1 hypothetical protein [Rhizobium leguminosarum bv. viciae]TCA74780.1 hypothetical protein E0H74_34425 [Rhizobium leguminosarum bv. viciae]TCA87078.1 hypothetical protein E0H76_34885 [Rhizobium leguminosarum bv. viciae]
MTADDALAMLDSAIAALQTLRERMANAGSEPEPAPHVADDDFALGNLIELPLAAQRFEVSKDKLRRWCRTDGIGVLRGGRWMVSVPRLRRHIGR